MKEKVKEKKIKTKSKSKASVKGACHEYEDRKAAVAKLLNPLPYDKETYEAAVESFTKCSLSIEEIIKLTATMTSEYQKQARYGPKIGKGVY